MSLWQTTPKRDIISMSCKAAANPMILSRVWGHQDRQHPVNPSVGALQKTAHFNTLLSSTYESKDCRAVFFISN